MTNRDDSVESPRLQSPLDIEPKFVFGLTTGVSGNCLYLNDDVIVFPAAGVIVVYDIKSHGQRFIPLTGPRKVITAMDLNTINHVLAVATVSDGPEDEESPIVSIYDLRTLELKYVFAEPDKEDGEGSTVDEDAEETNHRRRRFANVQFLYDNIFIAAFSVGVDDGSDCALYYYRWRSSKVDTCLRINGPVSDLALNPIDTAICCFVGKEFFRLMTRTEADWTQYGFREANGIDFTCVCWLCGDRCLAGTADGRVVIFKNGVLQNSYQAVTISDMDLTVKTENDRLSVVTSPDEDLKRTEVVRMCFTFQYGLVLVVGETDIYYFRITDEGRRYVRRHMYRKLEYRNFQASKVAGEPPLHQVESVCVGPNGKRLTCMTRSGQLYWMPLAGEQGDDDGDDSDDSFNSPIEINQSLGNDFHYGGVESLSTCLRRPLLMTCGKIDSAVKLWDYVECTLLFTKQYSTQVRSVSIHPTGLYSVVVFLDHVEYQMVQTEDLVPMQYFPIRGYAMVSFSGSGHMFALAKRDEIDIYSSLMFEKRFSCHGNLGTIEKMVWCNYDKNIVAYDTVGAICTFETQVGKVISHIAPYSGAAYTGLAVTNNVDIMFVITKDGILKQVNDRKVEREVNFYQGPLNEVFISKSNLTLFMATQNGVVLTVALPMGVSAMHKEFKMHNKSITKMRLAMDDSVLISCSDDGSMCIWEIKDHDINDDNINKRNAQFDAILVNSTELDRINENIVKTELVVNKLETERAHTINALKKSNEQNIELKKISNTDDHLDFVEKNNKVMVSVHREIEKLEYDLVTLKKNNQQKIFSLDAYYSEILVNKHNKYLELKNKVIATTTASKISLDALQEKLNRDYRDAVKDYEEKLRKKDEEIIKSKDKLINTKDRLQTLVGDTEKDVDKDISNVKKELTAKLKDIKELLLNSVVERVRSKMQYELLVRRNVELRQTTDNLESDLKALNTSVVEKNDRVVDLSMVLKQRLEEIQRISEHSLEVKAKMKHLSAELYVKKESTEQLKRSNISLELNVENIKNSAEKNELAFNVKTKKKKHLEFARDELLDEKSKIEQELKEKNTAVKDSFNFLKQMKHDLHVASRHYPNVTESQKAVTDFFNKYLGDIETNKNFENEDLQAREEFARQRQFLELRIDDMKQAIELLITSNEMNYSLIEQNTWILEEIDDAREKAKMYLYKYNNLKHLLPKKHTNDGDNEYESLEKTN